jgi:3-oxoacyl-[acyl-carrier protein] reductase
MDLELKGRRALVTGASEGIGHASALALAAEGCDVAFCSRRAPLLEELAEEVRARHGVAAHPIVADCSTLEGCESFVEEAANRLGGIDVVVNNAGSSMFGLLDDVPDERWLDDITLKLLGYVRVSRAALRHMSSGGRIVMIGGNAGRQPLPYHLPGGAANAGVLNFTRALADQIAGRNIQVVNLAPGPVATARYVKQIQKNADIWDVDWGEAEQRFVAEMPLKRVPTAEQVAGVVAFLASPRADHLTGTTVTMDGGITRGI